MDGAQVGVPAETRCGTGERDQEIALMSVLAKWYAVVVGMLQEEQGSEEASGCREEGELRAHAGAGDERSSEALEPGSSSIRRRSWPVWMCERPLMWRNPCCWQGY